MAAAADDEPRVFRPGGVSYLRIPAPDPQQAAAFYRAVFDWTVDSNRDDPSFEDGTGHVIGHFIKELPVAGAAGVRPYVFVESVGDTLDRVAVHGGELATAPYREGELSVATFRDPAGNEIGVWQLG
jgi:predicted enzyme related to lactoylglutathione lyase